MRLAPGRHRVRVTTADGTAGTSVITVVDPATATRGVVSDLDDRVVATRVPRPLVALGNLLLRREAAREAVPGMASFLTAVSAGFVVYLSTGARNNAPAVPAFLARYRCPDSAVLLSDWGPSTEWELDAVTEHKRTSLRRLRSEFPELTWTLVGDDGQRDATIYEPLAAEYPDAVDLIAIRELRAGTGTAARPAGSGSRNAPVRRVAGADGHALLRALRD